jgi:tetratricopeptide (TPR) repeat protein
MKKYLQITLINTFITLFLISFNAYSDELSNKISSCLQSLDKGDLTQAVTASGVALKIAPDNRDALLCKGRALGAQGNYDAALSTLDSAAKQSQPGFEQIITNIFIGNLHKANNKNADALASYENSLAICEAEKNDKFKRINLNLIGETQAQNNDQKAALASYIAGSKLSMNDNERADSYERLATAYSALDQHDLAIENQLKGVLMQEKSGTLDQYADASLALGHVYTQAKDYKGAENTYAKLLQFAKDNGGAYYEARASYELAQIKALRGDASSAKTLLADALKISKNIGEGDLTTKIETALKQ